MSEGDESFWFKTFCAFIATKWDALCPKFRSEVCSCVQLKNWIFRITTLGTWNLMRIRRSEAISWMVYHWIITVHTLVCTYLLNYSMEQSPSWETIQFLASQEIPRILGNPKVHYGIHKCPPHPTSWRSILILSSHLRLCLPSGLFPSGFNHQNPVYNYLLPPTHYMPRPTHSFRFYHPHHIGWGIQIIKLLIM
jgi:hypothetical protein